MLSPSQPEAPITITARKDDNAELKETHVVQLQGPTVPSTVITVITPPDLPPQAPLCAALDISEEDCPTLSTGDDSSAFWSASTPSGAIGGMALRSGMIDHSQRSCLGVTLQRPVRVAFRWRASSQAGLDRLHYIDDGRRSPAIPAAETGDRFLSGDVAWRDASFDYVGAGPVSIEWCYIKSMLGASGDDAGYLDRLQITRLNNVTVTPPRALLSEGGSATLTLSLDETPQSEVTVKLTVPAESANDIAVSPAQLVLSASQPAMPITVTASRDGNAEPREAHVVQLRGPTVISTVIPVVTSPTPCRRLRCAPPWTSAKRIARHSQPATAARRCGRLARSAMRSGARPCAAERLATAKEAA